MSAGRRAAVTARGAGGRSPPTPESSGAWADPRPLDTDASVTGGCGRPLGGGPGEDTLLSHCYPELRPLRTHVGPGSRGPCHDAETSTHTSPGHGREAASSEEVFGSLLCCVRAGPPQPQVLTRRGRETLLLPGPRARLVVHLRKDDASFREKPCLVAPRRGPCSRAPRGLRAL